MGDLSTHFNRSEFACRCGCGRAVVATELVQLLEAMCQQLQARLRIASGCRCEAHNAAVGGSPQSAHLFGYAADLTLSHPEDRYAYLVAALQYRRAKGLGLYRSKPLLLHVDVAPADRWPRPRVWFDP